MDNTPCNLWILSSVWTAAEINRNHQGTTNQTWQRRSPSKVYDKIGKKWVPHFLLQRHPDLASVRPRSIDAARIKAASPEQLQRWFDDLEKTLAEFNIKSANIYDMDESGFTIC